MVHVYVSQLSGSYTKLLTHLTCSRWPEWMRSVMQVLAKRFNEYLRLLYIGSSAFIADYNGLSVKLSDHVALRT